MANRIFILLVLAVPAQLFSQTLTIDFSQGIYHPGDSVTATVTASSDFGIDTDLGASSSTVPAGVSVPVPIGPVSGPGIYQVRFYTDSNPNAYLAILVFAPDSQGNLQLYASNVTGKASPVVVNKALLKTFWDAAIRNNLIGDAFLTAAADYVRQHPESVALTAAMALTPGFEEGAAVTAGATAIDVLQDFLKKIVDEELEDNLISDSDAATIRTWFARSDGVIQIVEIVASGGAIEVRNFFHAANAALDFSKQTDANTTVHGAIGFIEDKVSVLLEITHSADGREMLLAASPPPAVTEATVAGLSVRKDSSTAVFRGPFTVDVNGASNAYCSDDQKASWKALGRFTRSVSVVRVNGSAFTQKSGPNAGCYVTPTKLTDESHKDPRDLERYVDSTSISYVALPDAFLSPQSGGLALGDVGVVYDPRSSRLAFGIIADDGTGMKLGGSVHLADSLGLYAPGKRRVGGTLVASSDIVYIFFPNSRKSRDWQYTRRESEIERDASRLFEKWGGVVHLKQVLDLSRTKNTKK